MKSRAQAGFTLMEMAVVLVIVGIIAGGVMFGRTMLVTSRLQTVLTDEDSYATAAANFQQQYQGLPGDLASATTNWGTDSATCAIGGGTSGTCDGNADGKIGYTGSENEVFRVWQHLYYAGLYSKRLNGVASTVGVYGATPGTNVPAGSIEGSGFSMVWTGTWGLAISNYFQGKYANVILFGAASNSYLTSGPLLTAEQAASLDSKTDDGIPSTGKIRTFVSTSTWDPNCATTSVTATAAYNVSLSGRLCSLIFITGF